MFHFHSYILSAATSLFSESCGMCAFSPQISPFTFHDNKMYPWKWYIILPTIWVCQPQGAHSRELTNQTGLGYHYLLHYNRDQKNSQGKLKLTIKILKVRPWRVFDFLIFLNVLVFLRMWTSNEACFRSVVVID